MVSVCMPVCWQHQIYGDVHRRKHQTEQHCNRNQAVHDELIASGQADPSQACQYQIEQSDNTVTTLQAWAKRLDTLDTHRFRHALEKRVASSGPHIDVLASGYPRQFVPRHNMREMLSSSPHDAVCTVSFWVADVPSSCSWGKGTARRVQSRMHKIHVCSRTRVDAVHPRYHANHRRQISRQNTCGQQQGRGKAQRSHTMAAKTQMPNQQNYCQAMTDAEGPGLPKVPDKPRPHCRDHLRAHPRPC